MHPEESNEEESADRSGSVVVARSASGRAPARRGKGDFIEAEDVIDTLHDEQLAVSEELDSLTRTLAERGVPLHERQAIATVRDALAVFLLAAGARPVPRAFLPEAALARYLVALYAAIHVAIQELVHVGPSVHDAPLPVASPVVRELAKLADSAADPDAVDSLTIAFERLVTVVDGARSALS